MSNLQKIDAEIESLTSEIGLSVDDLKQLLKRDDKYIEELVNQGHPPDVAERASFIGDLRNVISLMISHKFTAKTAARVLSQTPEEPFNFSSTEDEEETEEEEQKHDGENPNPGRRSIRPNFIRPKISSSSSSSSNLASSSINSRSCNNPSNSSSSSSSSSEDEAVEAKRLKLDPDYVPSTASTSPLTTANNSQETSEKEESTEIETEEDEESWHPSDSTSAEIVSSPEDD
jgi:hypothetical protein